MEFRNHQVKIGHVLAQFRGNPLALVLLILLVPIALAIVLLVGIVVTVGIIVMRLVHGILSLLSGRRPAVTTERTPFPFGGARRSAESVPPSNSSSSGTIDVEIVKKSEDHST